MPFPSSPWPLPIPDSPRARKRVLDYLAAAEPATSERSIAEAVIAAARFFQRSAADRFPFPTITGLLLTPSIALRESILLLASDGRRSRDGWLSLRKSVLKARAAADALFVLAPQQPTTFLPRLLVYAGSAPASFPRGCTHWGFEGESANLFEPSQLDHLRRALAKRLCS